MVKLNAVTVRIKNLDSVIDAGMKLGGNHLGDFDVMVTEKFHRIAKLAVVSDLQPERGTFGVGAETEHVPERQRQERQRVMLRVATKKKAAVAFEPVAGSVGLMRHRRLGVSWGAAEVAVDFQPVCPC